MTNLQTHRKAAKSGKAKSLVIFLHGYGADGQDLLGLADPLCEHLPDTVFLAPDAPQRCVNNPAGFQWFPIPRLDGSSEADMQRGQQQAVDGLNGWLDSVLHDENIAAENTVLIGFSQGTMMALHVAPRRSAAFAGVIGFSGKLLHPDRLASDARVKPPVLLVHGDADEMVPPAELPAAAGALSIAGFEVNTHVSKGTGHGIAPDGLGVALQFLQMKLD